MGMAIRFNDEWLSEPSFADWLVKVSNDESRAYCRYCAIVLRAHKSDLMSHATTGKHVKNISNAANAPTGPISVQIIVDDTQPAAAPAPGTAGGYSGYYQGQSGASGGRAAQRIQYPKKYRVEWEQIEEFKDWLGPDPTDVSRATCKMCGVQLRAHKHDLLLHSRSSKHKKCQEEFSEGHYVSFGDPVHLGDGMSEDTEVIDLQDPDEERKDGESGMEGTDTEGQTNEANSSSSIKSEQVVRRVASGIVRVAAPGHRFPPIRKRRRFTVNDVIDAIHQNHFTGYELLQICKAAIPKL